MENGVKIKFDVAFKEVFAFITKYNEKDIKRNKITESSVKEDYLDMIEAVQYGNLTFNEKKVPHYRLKEILFGELKDTSLHIDTVSFRSRIREAERTLIMDGLDIKKQAGTFTLKTMSYISRLSMTEVKELGKEDYEVVSQICTVF